MIDIFKDIYEKNLWGNPESVSGSGSTLESTKKLRQQLVAVLEELKVRSVVDAPCGDMNWMRHLEYQFEKYIGIDIVPDIIDNLRASNQDTRYNFQVGNIVTDVLPQADLLFCRDCLVHLPLSCVEQAIKKFKIAGFTYLMTTTFPSYDKNVDIEAGQWRPINLQAAPFALQEPLILILESPGNRGLYSDKSIGVWKL